MDLENLSQFNKRLFKKFLGVYVKTRRTELKLSVEKISESMNISVKEFKNIESGQWRMNQYVFDSLSYHLAFDPNELVNICRVTQIQHIMNVCKEIDELYPR
jgi:hypothetical protein